MSAEEHIQEAVDLSGRARELIKTGNFLYGKGWVPASSGCLSARINDEHFAITLSDSHKGELTEKDVIRVDRLGSSLINDQHAPRDTLLHTAIYNRYPQVNVILHTHSVKATLLSRQREGELVFEDYELLKAFEGRSSHEGRIIVPIFPNDQDIARLSLQVEEYLDHYPAVHGYLVANRGLYTWGDTLADALRYIEVFEFLFECELAMQHLTTLETND